MVTTANRDLAFELKEIKYFKNNCPIKWEPYVSKRCPRCYKCQEYKHLARNCFKKQRCTRCKTIHGPNICPKPKMTPDMNKEQRMAYWCHPCQMRGHCADSQDCPTKIKYDEEQRERAAAQQAKNGKYYNNKNYSGTPTVRAGHVDRHGQEGRTRAAPTAEDFVVTSKKETRRLPTPVMTQPQTAWNTNNISRPGRERVSTPYESAWAEIEDTSKDLFGRTPAQMIALCEKFVAQTRNMDKHQKMTEYIRFYSFISQCGN